MGGAPIAAAELSKLVGTAAEAATQAAAGDAPDAAALARCLDVLKVLAGSLVTAGVLKETDAGKRVNRLSKSSEPQVAAAAGKVVAAWKACVKKQAAESGGLQPSASLLGASSTASLGALAGGDGSDQQQQQEAASARPAGAKPLSQQQQRPGSSSSSMGAGRPGSSGSSAKQPPQTGDSKRDKIRVLLMAGLLLVPADARGGQEPALTAAEIESAIFGKFGVTGPEYAAKVRSISYNLKDPSNPELRRRVLCGEIDPQELVGMTPEEMASAERRAANAQIRAEVAADLVRGQQQAASTDMFKCGRCKQKKCTYYQLQTRSADEPMTTFVTCVNCNNKWKFC